MCIVAVRLTVVELPGVLVPAMECSLHRDDFRIISRRDMFVKLCSCHSGRMGR